jgi:hypothetical protein
MYKAFLLILCLLACTTIVVAQGPDTRRPAPRPTGQQVSPATPILSKEQFERLRTILQPFYEKQGGSAPGTVPMPNQRPLTLSPAIGGPLGGFPDFTPDPNLLKHGPFGPNVKYGPLGPIGEGQGAQQSANAQLNLGVGLNLEGFKQHPLDKAINQSIGAIDGLIEVFNNRLPRLVDQYQQQVAASNQPPVPRPADNQLTRPRSASAASTNFRCSVGADNHLLGSNRRYLSWQVDADCGPGTSAIKLTYSVLKDGRVWYGGSQKRSSEGELHVRDTPRCSSGTHRYQVKGTLNYYYYNTPKSLGPTSSRVVTCSN